MAVNERAVQIRSGVMKATFSLFIPFVSSKHIFYSTSEVMSKKKKIAFLSGFLSLKWEHTYRETVGYIEKKESC